MFSNIRALCQHQAFSLRFMNPMDYFSLLTTAEKHLVPPFRWDVVNNFCLLLGCSFLLLSLADTDAQRPPWFKGVLWDLKQLGGTLNKRLAKSCLKYYLHLYRMFIGGYGRTDQGTHTFVIIPRHCKDSSKWMLLGSVQSDYCRVTCSMTNFFRSWWVCVWIR